MEELSKTQRSQNIRRISEILASYKITVTEQEAKQIMGYMHEPSPSFKITDSVTFGHHAVIAYEKYRASQGLITGK